MAAGILLILGGILGALVGLAFAVLGSAFVDAFGEFGDIPELEGVDPVTIMSGFVVLFGIIIVVYSLVYVIGGIGVLRSRDWGRVLGIIVGILSGLIWLGSLGGPAAPGMADDTAASLVLLAIHAYIVGVLVFAWRTKPATG